ncbi:MAG: DNA polymerase, partial [Dongia sp.]
GDLLGGGSAAPNQLPLAKVLAMLKPLLEDPGVLKIGHSIKYDVAIMAKHGIRLAPIDDTMLISYVLEGALHAHNLDELAGLHLGIDTIKYSDVTGTGKAQITFDKVPLDKALAYAAEDADVTLRLHHALKPLLEDPSVLKIGHSIKYDLAMMAKHGIKLAPIDDTMLISYVLEGALHAHNIDELASLHLGIDTIKYSDVTGTGKAQVTFDKVPLEKARDYAAEDADVTLRLHNTLRPRLISERLLTVYETIERPLIPVVAAMELAGIKVDVNELKRLSNDFGGRCADLEREIHRLAGTEFNIGSPKQLGEILFERLKLGEGGKKGKTGAYSTGADILE